MNPRIAYASASSLSRKATGSFGMDHVVLSIYGPSGGTICATALSAEQAATLIVELSLALDTLTEPANA